MRKNFGAKTWLYPMPVLIVGTYDENGVPNAMNAAWGGIYDTNLVMVCLADDHKMNVITSELFPQTMFPTNSVRQAFTLKGANLSTRR